MAKTKSRYVTRTITLPDGKRKYLYGKTKAEAEEKLAEVKRQIAGGLIVDDSTTFGELAKLWLEKYKAPYVQETTLHNIRCTINANLMPRFAALPVRKITPLMCQNLVADLVEQRMKTGAVVLNLLKTILNLGVELGMLERSPVSATLKVPDIPRDEDSEEKEVTPADVDRALLTNLKRDKPECYLLYVIGRETGMRIGEICGLAWDAIDLEHNELSVKRNVVWPGNDGGVVNNHMKTASGRRTLPITPLLRKTLMEFRPTDQKLPYFITNAKHTDVIDFSRSRRLWARIKKEAAQVDPEFAKGFTPHSMRHTYVTRLFEAGLDVKEVQYLAGHSSAATTLSIYTHYDEKSRKPATFSRVRAALTDNVIEFPA